jgi:hypothetical protein
VGLFSKVTARLARIFQEGHRVFQDPTQRCFAETRSNEGPEVARGGRND